MGQVGTESQPGEVGKIGRMGRMLGAGVLFFLFGTLAAPDPDMWRGAGDKPWRVPGLGMGRPVLARPASARQASGRKTVRGQRERLQVPGSARAMTIRPC